ncbi:ATP-dependent DNA helicase RecQ [Halobacillus sp. Marseille-Q1614]|uniref:RecQ family ATP-dependent DNA helicase n=1 Tax=Halobacillus sp. Marseille-Q1614 TaxID=2709134 RepID=UPI00156D69C0|nr:ATP-dependent DNA helicase RecQ [Halobacillus sp. Marseille-Q1614]
MCESLEKKLYQHFGFSSFRQGQREIIKDVLAGRDVLGILPTGVGKSLCFQLPAKCLSGTTIVISPLISLMVDQVKQLKAKGFKDAVAINSLMDIKQRSLSLQHLHRYSLIYLSPEMLQNPWMEKRLKQLKVDLLVIDEAHCISQWGHEFRTDYLKIGEAAENLGHPPVLALSATATPEVQKDIKHQLGLPLMKEHIYKMDKPNISLCVEKCEDPEEKLERIMRVLRAQTSPTMIYFSSRQTAEGVTEQLKQRLDQRIAFYHGGMEPMDRLLVQQQFMNDQLDVVCCTNAFGMGVDKPNIRRVIHYHFPTQLESYIQEIGRAGRDGLHCASLVLYTPTDHHLPLRLIQSELPEEADVNNLFRYLQSENELKENTLVEKLELSESQWNFLKYQLEQHRISNNDQSEAKVMIIEQLKERWYYKNRKFKEMLDWIHYDGCRREKLYAPFQEGYNSPEVPCCDYCGASIEDLSAASSREPALQEEQWPARLKAIFLQEPLNG